MALGDSPGDFVWLWLALAGSGVIHRLVILETVLTLNFARTAELKTSNEQIFTEIGELNVLQCKWKDFSINSLTHKNNILKISRFSAIRFVSHLLLSFVYNHKYYRKC